MTQDNDQQPPTRTFPSGAVTDETVILHLFAEAPQSDFVESLKEWFADKDFLTEKQFAALENMVYREDGEEREPTRRQKPMRPGVKPNDLDEEIPF